MGTYIKLSVLKDFKPIAPTGGSTPEQQHQGLLAQAAGNRLIALCDRLVFKQAVDVTELSEFKAFDDIYRRGIIISRVFYAIPADVVEANRQ